MNAEPRLTLVKPPEGGTTTVEKSISPKSARHRVLLAAGLIGACALTNVRLPLRTFWQHAKQPEGDRMELFLARCRRLESILPAAGRIGYLSLEHEPSGGASQYRILQYAFAPRLVERLSSATRPLPDPNRESPRLAGGLAPRESARKRAGQAPRLNGPQFHFSPLPPGEGSAVRGEAVWQPPSPPAAVPGGEGSLVSRLVIIQADDATAAQRLAEERGWELVAHAGGGLFAFRAEGR
jgi:hypothetical protein